MKIIFADDEINAIYNFVNGILDKDDLEYKLFKDEPFSILSYAAKTDITAAFLDVNMPNMNGFELAEKLLDLKPELKIVFITGLDISMDDLSPHIRKNTVGILYKPYGREQFEYLLATIRQKRIQLKVKMFDSFDCYIDGRMVQFSSLKSKELFALLLAYNGKGLTMGDAIAHLWPDYETEKSKTLYRDAVWRLRKALSDVNFCCISFLRALLVLDKENIVCDYWDYLDGLNNSYTGEFLKNYDWSVDYLAELDKIEARRRPK